MNFLATFNSSGCNNNNSFFNNLTEHNSPSTALHLILTDELKHGAAAPLGIIETKNSGIVVVLSFNNVGYLVKGVEKVAQQLKSMNSAFTKPLTP